MQERLIAFIFLFGCFVTIHAENMSHEKSVKIAQFTQDAKSDELIASPSGDWIAFVKKSNYIISSNCFYFSAKGDRADEIWIVNTRKMTKKLLVAPHFSCKEPSKIIIDPHNLQFSPDSKTLYFETSAWVTSGAVHAVDVNGSHLRFVTDGADLRVVQSGPYKGGIIVNQHRYRFKGDTPLGSYDWDWLFTPEGKQIKLYKKRD